MADMHDVQSGQPNRIRPDDIESWVRYLVAERLATQPRSAALARTEAVMHHALHCARAVLMSVARTMFDRGYSGEAVTAVLDDVIADMISDEHIEHSEQMERAATVAPGV